jgi:hypothetical protein
MSNEIAGGYTFAVKGQRYTLEYTWDAIAQINDTYADGHSLTNPNHLADIMAIGLQENHPGLTVADVKKFKLPILKAVEHVTKGLNIGYFGEEEKPAGLAENPPSDATPEA